MWHWRNSWRVLSKHVGKSIAPTLGAMRSLATARPTHRRLSNSEVSHAFGRRSGYRSPLRSAAACAAACRRRARSSLEATIASSFVAANSNSPLDARTMLAR